MAPHFPRVKIFSHGSDRVVRSSITEMYGLLRRLKLRACGHCVAKQEPRCCDVEAGQEHESARSRRRRRRRAPHEVVIVVVAPESDHVHCGGGMACSGCGEGRGLCVGEL